MIELFHRGEGWAYQKTDRPADGYASRQMLASRKLRDGIRPFSFCFDLRNLYHTLIFSIGTKS